MSIVKFEVIREVYHQYIIDTTIERTFGNIMQATGYIRRHRDELAPRERFGLVGVTDMDERVTLH